jgi:phosphate:Na+ symporter
MPPLLLTLGGLGLFLYGMGTMTSGLRKLAGDRLRQWIGRTTATPMTGALTGAVTTAIVQSSSATTVATVGFVAAGLLTFPQALGVIFGANIGTTLTGWMVALIGFKLKLSAFALPLLFVAAILYLFKGRRRVRGLGKALAGFSLIFIGIAYLQEGLAAYRGVIDLSAWRADHMGNRILLVVLGGLMTLITQSSSATVAASLTALSTSILTLPQTAAVIIGADIGTTVTAALATIGGTTASRRTGFAHVIYNLLTGVVAFLMLPLYLWAVEHWNPTLVTESPEVVAVGFHSFFNILGVILALPFTAAFARWIIHLFPEPPNALNASFDPCLLAEPRSAVASLNGGTRELAKRSLTLAAQQLRPSSPSPPRADFDSLAAAVNQGRHFAVRIGHQAEEDEIALDRVFKALHTLDHIERLLERLSDPPAAGDGAPPEALERLAKDLVGALDSLSEALATPNASPPEGPVGQIAAELESDRPQFRRHLMAQAAAGTLTASTLDAHLDRHRWLRRLAYHAWRIAVYQQPKLPSKHSPSRHKRSGSPRKIREATSAHSPELGE